jgi:hypothetical protein
MAFLAELAGCSNINSSTSVGGAHHIHTVVAVRQRVDHRCRKGLGLAREGSGSLGSSEILLPWDIALRDIVCHGTIAGYQIKLPSLCNLCNIPNKAGLLMVV